MPTSTRCAGLSRLRAPQAFLYAFDLLELNGEDLRLCAWTVRVRSWSACCATPVRGSQFSEHVDAGEEVFAHACRLGCEGIVSKRRESRYKSGRSFDWIKVKNSDAPAYRRVIEEEWRR